MNEVRAWFNGRSLRERRLILVMLALLVVAILWGLLILPVRNGLSSTRERYTDAVVRVGEAEAGLRAVKSIQRRQRGSVPLPLADTVRARADGAGFTLASLDPEANDRVRLSIATAKAGALMAWLAALEDQGVLVDGLTITPNGGGTVTAQMTLKARGN